MENEQGNLPRKWIAQSTIKVSDQGVISASEHGQFKFLGAILNLKSLEDICNIMQMTLISER